jgi:very-short-patch-repair endonuclease
MSKDNLYKGAHPWLFAYARQNRKQQTQAEKVLWDKLRNGRLHGFKFRRQHPIYDFIADFYCASCSLVVEIDGAYHEVPDQATYDRERSYTLNEINVKVVRFTNKEVLENIDFVLTEICQLLTSPKNH